MLDENALTSALNTAEYSKVGKLTYKARWSTLEVEHFLYFCLYGDPKEFMSADFGLRSPEAEEFGIECVRAYGGDLYRVLNPDPRFDCTMRFSVGKIAGWTPRWSVTLSASSVSSLVERVRADLANHVAPIVQNITTKEEFLKILVKDEEPWTWIRVNAAIRAAQVVYLGHQLGMSSEDIKGTLGRFEDNLQSCFVDGTNSKAYVDNVVRRSAARMKPGA